MTMVECIEQRKTTLSGVAEAALEATIHDGDSQADEWGVTVEVAQLAQVFIVDTQLRQQLEAEVRNEIKLKSDQSNMRAQEETRLAEMASQGRVEEQKLAGDTRDPAAPGGAGAGPAGPRAPDAGRERRHRAPGSRARAGAIPRGDGGRTGPREHGGAGAAARIAKERGILAEELELRKLQNQVKAFDVERELMLPRAEQDMRREMLPLEQAPQIVEAASRVLQGTNLSIYGEGGQLLGQLAPLFEILACAVQQATQAPARQAPGPDMSA